MRTFYAHSLYALSGDQPLENLKRDTIFTLCRAIANQPKLKGRQGTNLTSTYSEDMEGGLTMERLPDRRPMAALLDSPLSTVEDSNPTLQPPSPHSQQERPQEERQLHSSAPQNLEDVVPPLKLHSASSSPRIDIFTTFSMDSCSTPHLRASQSDILIPKMVSQDCLQEMKSTSPSNPAALPLVVNTLSPSARFPSFSSLRSTLLERMSPKSGGESSSRSGLNFIYKVPGLRKLSCPSMKDLLDGNEVVCKSDDGDSTVEKRRGSYRSYFHQQKTNQLMKMIIARKRSDLENDRMGQAGHRQKTEFEDCDEETVVGKPKCQFPRTTI